MLPDPGELRAAATGLVVVAGDVRTAAAALAATLAATDWAAPAVDGLRREFAVAQARAEAGCRDLEAGAAHLRRLAEVLEQLAQDCARLRAAAVHDLERQQVLAPPGEPADALARRVAALPPVGDPAWAHRAGARPVALPPRSPFLPAAVVPSPAGTVRVDLPQVRALTARTRSTAVAAYDGGDAATRRTAALDLARLDPYGLDGSASADWLRRLGDRTGQLAGAAGEWQHVAAGATALTDLLAGADSGLLADPRLGLAVQVLVAVRATDGSVGPLLDGVSPADRAWLAREVPGLPAAPAHPVLHALSHVLDGFDGANELHQAVHDAAAEVEAEIAAFRAEAARLAATTATLTGAALRAAQEAAQVAHDGASGAAARGRQVLWLARQLPSWTGLRRLSTTPVRATGPLRHVPWLGAVLLPVTVALDIRSGTSPVLAVVKALLSFALAALVTAAVTALAGLLLASAPAGLVVALAVLAGIGVGLLVGPYLDRGLAALGRGLGRLGGGLGRGLGRLTRSRPSAPGRLGAPAARGPAGRVRPVHGVAGRRPTARAAGRGVTRLSMVRA